MKKLLYIGHEYHNKTRSTQFLKDIFEQQYEVDYFSFDPYADDWAVFKNITQHEYHIVILFQIMPSIKELQKHIQFKHCVFFPMFDGAPSRQKKIWFEYTNCTIINFSKTLHEELIHMGLSSHYIQYFPKPVEIDDFGDDKSIFFWQRTGDITINTVENILNPEDIKHLHFHQAIDPCHEIIEPSDCWNNKISYSTWYDTREEMQSDMKKFSLYIAPRRNEGIGMSFLEAMSMGRCVIAPNYPTMNEYIAHNKTGLLYDLDNPVRLGLSNSKDIQKEVVAYITKGYENWEANKFIILDWIEQEPKINSKLLQKAKIKNICKRFLRFVFTTSKTKSAIRIKIFGIRVFKIHRKRE